MEIELQKGPTIGPIIDRNKSAVSQKSVSFTVETLPHTPLSRDTEDIVCPACDLSSNHDRPVAAVNRALCVRQAVSHLQLLETAVENYYRSDVLTPTSATMQSTNSAIDTAKPEARLGSRLFRSRLSFERFPEKLQRNKEDSELHVYGVGGLPINDRGDFQKDIPQISPCRIFTEVRRIVLALDADLANSERLIDEEQRKASEIDTKLRSSEKQRLQRLADVSQAEHEHCANDIRKLKWHVAQKQLDKSRYLQSLNQAKRLHCDAVAELQFIQESSPHIREKLSLETEAMAQIDGTHEQTQEELTMTENRLGAVRKQSAVLKEKAEIERSDLRDKVSTIEKRLADVIQQLKDAEAELLEHEQQTKEARMKSSHNERESLILENKLEQSKLSVGKAAKRVENVEHRLTDLRYQEQRLCQDNDGIKERAETMRATHEDRIEAETGQISRLQQHFDELDAENERVQIINDELNRKLKQIEKDEKLAEGALERLRRDRDQTQAQLEMLTEQCSKFSIIHKALAEELSSEKAKALDLERKLKEQLASLQSQTLSEKAQKQALFTNICMDQDEYTRLKDEFSRRHATLADAQAELDSRIATLEARVNKFRDKYDERCRVLHLIAEQIESTVAQHSETETRLSAERDKLISERDACQDVHNICSEELRSMNWQLSMMEKKLNEMRDATRMMERTQHKTEDRISEYTELRDELSTQLDEKTALQKCWQSAYYEVLSRLQKHKQQHADKVEELNERIRNYELALEQMNSDNATLAASYRRLQLVYSDLKNELMGCYDDRIYLEGSSKNMRQLLGLQRRIEVALATYYRTRGRFCQAEIDALRQRSANSQLAVRTFKRQIDRHMNGLYAFLQAQVVRALNASSVLEIETSANDEEVTRVIDDQTTEDKHTDDFIPEPAPV